MSDYRCPTCGDSLELVPRSAGKLGCCWTCQRAMPIELALTQADTRPFNERAERDGDGGGNEPPEASR